MSSRPFLKMITDQHIQSAIIGFWRQGAIKDAIARIMGVSISFVEFILTRYFKNPDLW